MDRLEQFSPPQTSDGHVVIRAIGCEQSRELQDKLRADGVFQTADEYVALTKHMFTCVECRESVGLILDEIEQRKKK